MNAHKLLEYKLQYRRHLPHYQPFGATLFITFRLAGSIPRTKIMRLLEEAEQIEKTLSLLTNSQERAKRAYLEQRRLFGKWDATLDANKNEPLWLKNSRVASLVAESIHHRNSRVYNLDAFCIMPNHVHLVCTPLTKSDGSYYSISAIMHSLKLYTARRANELLGRQGNFWQHENYDHVIRNKEEWRRIITYVVNNPVKAGLTQHWKEWEWTYCKYPL